MKNFWYCAAFAVIANAAAFLVLIQCDGAAFWLCAGGAAVMVSVVVVVEGSRTGE